jgi:hypothetical protein
MKDQKTCFTCFFTEQFPGITLLERDVCNSCRDGKIAAERRTLTPFNLRELQKLVTPFKRKKSGKYNCIIGASGGLDSSYVIYVAKKKLGLNPLVVSYDSGFNDGHAIGNLKTLCARLGVDLRIVRSSGNHDKKYVRSIIRALRPLNAYWGICRFCHFILPTVVYRYALEEGISVALNSDNIFERKLRLPGDFRRRFMIRAFLRRGLLKAPAILFHLAAAQVHLQRLKMEFYIPPITNLFKDRPPKSPVQKINITKYVPWDIDRIIRTLEKEGGWKLPGHPNIGMRFDCTIEDSFINHTYKWATGMTVHGIIACNLIQGGVQNKRMLKQAVEYYDGVIERRKTAILRDLGIRQRKSRQDRNRS